HECEDGCHGTQCRIGTYMAFCWARRAAFAGMRAELPAVTRRPTSAGTTRCIPARRPRSSDRLPGHHPFAIRHCFEADGHDEVRPQGSRDRTMSARLPHEREELLVGDARHVRRAMEPDRRDLPVAA